MLIYFNSVFCLLAFLFLVFVVFSFSKCSTALDDVPFKLSLTVSAKLGAVDVSWYNLDTPNGGYILLTDAEPTAPFHKYESNAVVEERPQDAASEQQSNVTSTTHRPHLNRIQFNYGNQNASALYWVKPTDKNGWLSTSILFDSDHLQSITVHTKCYGYWAVYLNNALDPVASTCIRAYATWMNDARDHLKHFRMRDLFIVGTHDSGSYRMNFNAMRNDTLVTKYSLTQVNHICFQYSVVFRSKPEHFRVNKFPNFSASSAE